MGEPAAATQAIRVEAPSSGAVEYGVSPGLAHWQSATRQVIANSPYQSGRLYLVGANPEGGTKFHERLLAQAMGLGFGSAAIDGPVIAEPGLRRPSRSTDRRAPSHGAPKSRDIRAYS